DYEMAVSEFNEVINKYPKNAKTPSAMLKIAYSKVRLNQVTDAISVFNDIIKKYPNSDEARLSKERLKSIKK
ncbi:MAG TPA: tetratricopeptide repeat protein, partial [Nitrospinota bacterium]|nr:tetratricopeptide repeat protein [Nitrospinota bacterium]